MPRTDVSMTASQLGDRDMREFSRIPVVIPVCVEIFPPSKAVAFAAVPGTLLNIGRSGGRVRVRCESPPQTRLFISLPVGTPSIRLPADVIWACHPFDRGPEPPVYGVRWMEPLSSAILESILQRQGLASKREVAHAPRSWE